MTWTAFAVTRTLTVFTPRFTTTLGFSTIEPPSVSMNAYARLRPAV